MYNYISGRKILTFLSAMITVKEYIKHLHNLYIEATIIVIDLRNTV